MNDDQLKSLREHVTNLLQMKGAHADFEQTIAGIPAEVRGKKAKNIPYTLWGLLEHMRLAQWDILEFSRDAKHVSPDWPKGYWPKTDAPPSAAAWNKSVKQFREDLKAVLELVNDPATELFARIPHGTGQTILREALLVADHNSYHLGQMLVLRRALGAWKD